MAKKVRKALTVEQAEEIVEQLAVCVAHDDRAIVLYELAKKMLAKAQASERKRRAREVRVSEPPSKH